METTIQGKNECESTVKKIIHKPGIESRGDGKSKTVDKKRCPHDHLQRRGAWKPIEGSPVMQC
jgi:hypothetical protein